MVLVPRFLQNLQSLFARESREWNPDPFCTPTFIIDFSDLFHGFAFFRSVLHLL